MFGANKQGVEYYWNGTTWVEGQKKEKVNTIQFCLTHMM